MKSNLLGAICFFATFLFFIPYTAADIQTGLVAYYPFNGNANDESGNGNNGAVHGATLTADRLGNPNSAYAFDGVDDYISIPYSSDFDFSQEKQMSYGIWLYLNSLQQNDHVPLGQDAPCSHFAYAIDVYEDRHVEAAIHTSDCWLLAVSSDPISLNNWYHIFVTADENNLRLYINGKIVTEEPLGASIWNGNTYDTNTYIGAWGGLNPLTQFVDGIIDEVRIYNRALSAAEVLELYNGSQVVDIEIDIKPGNIQNVINPRSKGGVWVAILSETSAGTPFDPASQVDIPTVALGPDGAKAVNFKVKDLNKDGLGDLLLRFRIPETGIACGETEATITGETFDEQSFAGTDLIRTVGCKKAKKSGKK